MTNILYRINNIYTTDLETHLNEVQELGGVVLLDKLDSPSEVVKISDRVTRLSYKYIISGLSESIELLTVDKIQLGNNNITNLLLNAEKLYPNKYDRFSIQLDNNEIYLIGHEEVEWEADSETTLGKVSDLINQLD